MTATASARDACSGLPLFPPGPGGEASLVNQQSEAGEKTNNDIKRPHSVFMATDLKRALDVAEFSLYVSLIYLLSSLAFHTFSSLLKFWQHIIPLENLGFI